jgi:hypothetical protein
MSIVVAKSCVWMLLLTVVSCGKRSAATDPSAELPKITLRKPTYVMQTKTVWLRGNVFLEDSASLDEVAVIAKSGGKETKVPVTVEQQERTPDSIPGRTVLVYQGRLTPVSPANDLFELQTVAQIRGSNGQTQTIQSEVQQLDPKEDPFKKENLPATQGKGDAPLS